MMPSQGIAYFFLGGPDLGLVLMSPTPLTNSLATMSADSAYGSDLG